MKGKKDNLHSEANKIMECSKEHFDTHLNTTFQHKSKVLNDIPDAPNNVIQEPPVSKNEISDAVRSIKHGRAVATNEITAEVIKETGE